MDQFLARFRQIGVFLLGALVLLDGVFGQGERIMELIIGMVLIGILPLDQLIERLPGGKNVPTEHREEVKKDVGGT